MTTPAEPRDLGQDQVSRFDPRWTSLHRVAAGAAWASAVFLPVQVAVFLIWPPPLEGTAADWFDLFERHPWVGLLDLDLLLVADNVLLAVLLLALWVLLRRGHESLMAVATALGLLGVVCYVTTNPAVGMLRLSRDHAAATNETERTVALAAGETLLSTWQGTAFHVGYLCGSLAGILIGVAMLRSDAFGRTAGAMAVLGNSIGLGLYVPVVGVYISVFSVLFLEIWYVLVARRLQHHARTP